MKKFEKGIKNLQSMEKRTTPQVMEVLKFMEGNTSHPSAEDVYEKVKEVFPAISLNTVSNISKMLSEVRQIQEIFIDKEGSKYDSNTIHYQIICLRCNNIDDISVDLPEEIKQKYDIKGYRVNLYGYCKDCKDKGSQKTPRLLSSHRVSEGGMEAGRRKEKTTQAWADLMAATEDITNLWGGKSAVEEIQDQRDKGF